MLLTQRRNYMQKSRFSQLTSISVFSLLFVVLFAMAALAQAPMVNTVLGPMSPDKLGITLVHEHFAFAYPGWFADATVNPYDFDAVLKTNIEVIKKAQKYGITTIIDATPNDTGGRDPELYKALAKQTGMNIICSTGLYTEHEGSPAYWKTRQDWYKTDISKFMAELFIKEITQGIGKSGVKAGVIKCGTSGGGKISPYETAVLKAAVAAQKATGVPIITHTEGPAGGIEQAELFAAEGANLKKVMIGHVSNSKDNAYHKAILAKGVNIAFDRIGLDIFNPTEVIAQNVADLVKAGYVKQIMLSHDTVNVWLGRSLTLDTPAEVNKALANWQIDHISKNFIPMLKAKGVTDEQIKTMMVDNPRNLFLGK
jgi:phosphotriesterase-related protein